MTFSDQIQTSATELKGAWTQLKGAQLRLPPACRDHWLKRAELHSSLAFTVKLLEVRKRAWDNVMSVIDPANIVTQLEGEGAPKPESVNHVKHGNSTVEFAIARHLSLVAYMTVTWSIYDRISNVCGRLASISEIASNPKQNPKACEDFLAESKKASLGFEANHHIKQAYNWSLKVSYKIRNWVAHEGYEQSGIPLFAGANIADGFKLSEAAAKLIQESCDYKIDDGITMCCIPAAEQSWHKRELIPILESYHEENDMMFRALVKWSVGSFTAQITAFAEDK